MLPAHKHHCVDTDGAPTARPHSSSLGTHRATDAADTTNKAPRHLPPLRRRRAAGRGPGRGRVVVAALAGAEEGLQEARDQKGEAPASDKSGPQVARRAQEASRAALDVCGGRRVRRRARGAARPVRAARGRVSSGHPARHDPEEERRRRRLGPRGPLRGAAARLRRLRRDARGTRRARRAPRPRHRPVDGGAPAPGAVELLLRRGRRGRGGGVEGAFPSERSAAATPGVGNVDRRGGSAPDAARHDEGLGERRERSQAKARTKENEAKTTQARGPTASSRRASAATRATSARSCGPSCATARRPRS